jgi:uncharacterized protein YbjT (DUF2867 family)
MSESNAVFVTGGSGFVGGAVIDELVRRGRAVVALTHGRGIEKAGVRTVQGDVLDARAMTEAMGGCAAVIHLVGIIEERPAKGVTFERMHVEATRAVVEAAKSAGVGRYVHMSALGTRANAVSEYHRTKWRAEELVRASKVSYTILRPSMIHGARGEFMRMAAGWARREKMPYLFMPYFSPAHLLQPVYVGDVARGFADALEKAGTVGKAYALAGPDVYAWPEFLRIVARAVVHRERRAIGIPAWYAKFLTRVVPRGVLPFNRDQVVMSQEDNTADIAPFVRDFGWGPVPLVESLGRYSSALCDIELESR